MDSKSVAADSFFNEIEEVLAMGVKENAGVAIAAQHRVVHGAGVMDSRLASHAARRIFRDPVKIKTLQDPLPLWCLFSNGFDSLLYQWYSRLAGRISRQMSGKRFEKLPTSHQGRKPASEVGL